MKICHALAVLCVVLSGRAPAQVLPALNVSLVGNRLPVAGTLGFENLALGGADLFTSPSVMPMPEASQRLPSLRLTAQLVDLPGLGPVGIRDLVIGGDRLLGTGLPDGPALQGTLQGVNGVIDVLDPGALLGELPGDAR